MMRPLLMVLCLVLFSAPAAAQFVPVDAAVQARELGRGVNAIGFDPLWDGLEKRRFKEEHFQKIHDAGFRTIRVGMFAFRHMDAANRVSADYLRSLDWVIDQALARGLNVIIEEHDMAYCGQQPEACRPKLLAFWLQIARRYRDKPAGLVFEPLNEPNSQLTDTLWNQRFDELRRLIRDSNPTRNIVVGPSGWNYFANLPNLILDPADHHLIATFHYYDPRRFTHQGAKWAEPDVRDGHDITWGSKADRKQLAADFAGVAKWSKQHDRPILLGEFGAYDAAPMASRVAYLDAVAREAERHGWSWLSWQFDHDFIVYDMEKDAWVEPILHALIPEAKAP